MVLFLHPTHSIRCSFTNKVATGEPVRSIRHQDNSGSGGEDESKFIRCVNGRQPKTHAVWTFGEDGANREVNPTARVDIGAGFVSEFATNYLTPT